MIRAAESKRVVASILDYFSQCERYAALRNYRATVLHYQECWALVFAQFFGELLPPLSVGTGTHRNTAPVLPHNPAPWFQLKYSRPVRRVIGRITGNEETDVSSDVLPVLFDVLECGHKLPARHLVDGGQPARHRWCNQCPPKGTNQCSEQAPCSPRARRSS